MWAPNSFLSGRTKVTFHYETRKCDAERTLIDESRTHQKPMELVLGKQFKLEVWESICTIDLQMGLHEVARFRCDKSLVQQYPFVSKTIRDAQKQPKGGKRKYCCGLTFQNEGTGYRDLDELFIHPQDLEFTIEILSIDNPDEYGKEAWQLSDDEKRTLVSRLREQGNVAYRTNNLTTARDAYSYAIGIIEQLMLKEKPNEPEWIELAQMKVPLLLNFSQCKLLEQDYYPVIEHCTEVLKYDPQCVKGLFRRGKAHAAVCNYEQARNDFQRVAELDTSLGTAMRKELAKLKDQQCLRDVEDRLKYCKFF